MSVERFLIATSLPTCHRECVIRKIIGDRLRMMLHSYSPCCIFSAADEEDGSLAAPRQHLFGRAIAPCTSAGDALTFDLLSKCHRRISCDVVRCDAVPVPQLIS